ncbi:hypothetical protein SSP35_19_00130 [Streptomyces sp. NBRC 110611]|uniref:hypothetical protein n=1 Tax=Streptomyces sp. NBRC 110611 TaxID=1621259 RepID=UPI0008352176|nr:hypothetical protein [Streptomyces sp. NBRC 110611]GAU70377.1 hypothetical protein SSP35_19_00130 [Streptomyces sp. NBRC 110611]
MEQVPVSGRGPLSRVFLTLLTLLTVLTALALLPARAPAVAGLLPTASPSAYVNASPSASVDASASASVNTSGATCSARAAAPGPPDSHHATVQPVCAAAQQLRNLPLPPPLPPAHLAGRLGEVRLHPGRLLRPRVPPADRLACPGCRPGRAPPPSLR